MARLTLRPQESVSQNPATQILVELFYDEVRQRVAGIAQNLILKWKPVVLDDFVKNSFFGLMPNIGVLFFCNI